MSRLPTNAQFARMGALGAVILDELFWEIEGALIGLVEYNRPPLTGRERKRALDRLYNRRKRLRGLAGRFGMILPGDPIPKLCVRVKAISRPLVL